MGIFQCKFSGCHSGFTVQDDLDKHILLEHTNLTMEQIRRLREPVSTGNSNIKTVQPEEVRRIRESRSNAPVVKEKTVQPKKDEQKTGKPESSEKVSEKMNVPDKKESRKSRVDNSREPVQKTKNPRLLMGNVSEGSAKKINVERASYMENPRRSDRKRATRRPLSPDLQDRRGGIWDEEDNEEEKQSEKSKKKSSIGNIAGVRARGSNCS